LGVGATGPPTTVPFEIATAAKGGLAMTSLCALKIYRWHGWIPFDF
jgi:hypothetical protein